LVEFIQANELRLIAFNEYSNEEGTEVGVVQSHPAADSVEFLLQVVRERAEREYAETLDSTTGIQAHTVDHHMTRVDIPTGMAFDSFCDAFEQAVPAFDFAHIRHITENGGTWQDIVAAVAAIAPNGMMRYATLDMTALYATTDHRTKAVEYFVGNHVIADQMVRRDPKILLYAPLRILAHGDADGDAVVSIDRPSTHPTAEGEIAGQARRCCCAVEGDEGDPGRRGVTPVLDHRASCSSNTHRSSMVSP
jgi:hypothetical protein